jgi:hypothetical protein
MNSRFIFQKNPPQNSGILKTENEAFKPSLHRVFMQNFSSLAYTQTDLGTFFTFFKKISKNFRKTLQRISEPNTQILESSTCKACACKVTSNQKFDIFSRKFQNFSEKFKIEECTSMFQLTKLVHTKF